jgi:hypothetical protein
MYEDFPTVINNVRPTLKKKARQQIAQMAVVVVRWSIYFLLCLYCLVVLMNLWNRFGCFSLAKELKLVVMAGKKQDGRPFSISFFELVQKPAPVDLRRAASSLSSVESNTTNRR